MTTIEDDIKELRQSVIDRLENKALAEDLADIVESTYKMGVARGLMEAAK